MISAKVYCIFSDQHFALSFFDIPPKSILWRTLHFSAEPKWTHIMWTYSDCLVKRTIGSHLRVGGPTVVGTPHSLMLLPFFIFNFLIFKDDHANWFNHEKCRWIWFKAVAIDRLVIVNFQHTPFRTFQSNILPLPIEALLKRRIAIDLWCRWHICTVSLKSDAPSIIGCHSQLSRRPLYRTRASSRAKVKANSVVGKAHTSRRGRKL